MAIADSGRDRLVKGRMIPLPIVAIDKNCNVIRTFFRAVIVIQQSNIYYRPKVELNLVLRHRVKWFATGPDKALVIIFNPGG